MRRLSRAEQKATRWGLALRNHDGRGVQRVGEASPARGSNQGHVDFCALKRDGVFSP